MADDDLVLFDGGPVAVDVGFFVLGDRCDRCGDVNYDETTRVCLTCTFPDDPCSRAYLDMRGDTAGG